VNQAASQQIGTMWGKSYVVAPGGIMVPPESPVRRPEDLAGVPVGVGYHSGSHYSAIQAMESFLSRDQIRPPAPSRCRRFGRRTSSPSWCERRSHVNHQATPEGQSRERRQ